MNSNYGKEKVWSDRGQKEKSKGSLKTKLVLYFTIIIFIVCVGVGSTICVKVSRYLQKNVENTLTQFAIDGGKIIDSRIALQKNMLENIAEDPLIKSSKASINEKQEFLQRKKERQEYVHLGFMQKDGTILTSEGFKISVDDKRFMEKTTSKISVLSDPYVDEKGELRVAYGVPVQDENFNFLGMLVGVREGKEITNLIDDIKFGESGKAFMINYYGTIVAHPDKELVKNKFNINEEAKKNPELNKMIQIFKNVRNNSKKFDTYRLNGKEKYIGCSSIMGSYWSIAVFADKSDVLADLVKIIWTIIIISVSFMIVGILCVLRLGSVIVKPISQISSHLKVIAKGDYTKRINSNLIKNKNEIGELSTSLKTMQENVKEMLKTVKKSSEEINDKSVFLNDVSEEIWNATHNVALAVGDVAKGNQSQAEDLNNIIIISNEFSGDLSSIVKSIKEAGEETNNIHVMAKSSNKEMSNVTASVENVSSAFEELNSKIIYSTESINKINDIINFINNISKKTNLLALNAAIEASRAGESGKGFSVVAEEIRRLAEQTRESASNIDDLIKKIVNNSSIMIETTEGMKKELDIQKSNILNSINSFVNITKAVEKVNDRIVIISSSASKIEKEKDSLLLKVESASSVAEEVSASSQQIAALSQQNDTSSKEIAKIAEELFEMIKEMIEQVEKFKL